MNNEFDELSLATLACRAGTETTGELENSDPLFLTSSFRFENAEQAAARFSGEDEGNVYSRFTNPTVRAFEKRLAALEGGEAGVATSSGMGAILTTFMSLLEAGDHVVASYSLFGSTTNLFKNVLAKFGLEFTFVDLVDFDAWSAAIRPNTKLLFLESPSNPLAEVADIERLADLAHHHNALLVVDNCFCTPILQRPMSLGADVIVHSATKYLDGQGRCVGGAIVTNQAVVEERIIPFMRSGGPSLSPFNAWVFLKGLETLTIRMRQHCVGASAIADWLNTHPRVHRVYYTGLAEHPQFELAARQQTGHGGIVSFEIDGSRERAWHIVDNLKLFSITANLGDSRSIVTHPATTTHSRISAEDRAKSRITEGLLRLSVGLEDPNDLIRDLDRALS